MRTTITLDDELVSQARRYTGIKEKPPPLSSERCSILSSGKPHGGLRAWAAAHPN